MLVVVGILKDLDGMMVWWGEDSHRVRLWS